jgi:uncharacterized membrane protein
MKTFFALLATLVIIDGIYLSWSIPNFYMAEVGGLYKTEINLFIGAIAWILLALGSNILVQQCSNSVKEAALKGAVFGLTVYGVYNSTNLSTLAGYSAKVAVADSIWGTILLGLVNGLVKQTMS